MGTLNLELDSMAVPEVLWLVKIVEFTDWELDLNEVTNELEAGVVAAPAAVLAEEKGKTLVEMEVFTLESDTPADVITLEKVFAEEPDVGADVETTLLFRVAIEDGAEVAELELEKVENPKDVLAPEA